MFYLRLLLLTILLPLGASAEMTLTSSWTLNAHSNGFPDVFENGQAYTLTATYDESMVPTPDTYWQGSWAFLESPIEISLSIPEAGLDITTQGYAWFYNGHLTFRSDFEGGELGEHLSLSWVFINIQDEGILNGPSLPVDVSQLPTSVRMYLLGYDSDYALQWVVGSTTLQPQPDGYGNVSDPFIGTTDEANAPVYDIDMSTYALSLEQVPEPATWAFAGGVLALGTSIIIRRRRIC